MLCFFNLNIPKRDLLNQTFFFQLLNVFEKLYDGGSLNDSLESWGGKFFTKNEGNVGNGGFKKDSAL
jgi:hypothetical protein